LRPFRTARRLAAGDISAGDVAEYLREETTGGQLLVIATAIALLWANIAPDGYTDFWTTYIPGPESLHLHLTTGTWAQDGLLALFFFVAGMEVKRELLVGELAGWRQAALPVFAAIGGMVVPALFAIAVSGGDALDGGAWAIPVATDIAFALGILAIAGSALPAGVRVLLLSMAVIDDLIAIALIALLFTSGLEGWWLVGGLLLCATYWLAHRLRVDYAWLLWVIAIGAWVCIHASGIHATVAGILLGLLTPVVRREGETQSQARRFEHRLHPVSAGICVPLFALAAAGIPLAAAGDAVHDPIAIGVVVALVFGKPLGIMFGAWTSVRLRLGALPDSISWADVLPIAALGGIGYTVSLLIAHLAFDDIAAQEETSVAVLVASALASCIGIALLRMRSRVHQEA
jgi:NhaA family Na+:H+ antiporter